MEMLVDQRAVLVEDTQRGSWRSDVAVGTVRLVSMFSTILREGPLIATRFVSSCVAAFAAFAGGAGAGAGRAATGWAALVAGCAG
jgi:hypothetical protein